MPTSASPRLPTRRTMFLYLHPPAAPFGKHLYPSRHGDHPRHYQASLSQETQGGRSSSHVGKRNPFLPIPSHKANYLGTFSAITCLQRGTRRDITPVDLEPPRNASDRAHQPHACLLACSPSRIFFFFPLTLCLKKALPSLLITNHSYQPPRKHSGAT